MGEATVKKPKKKQQKSLREGTTVYFIGFVKDKKEAPRHYMCKGTVVTSPSPYTKAPHKVRITAVGFSKFHNEGDEQDGRTLLNRSFQLPLEKLNTSLQDWLEPPEWWV